MLSARTHQLIGIGCKLIALGAFAMSTTLANTTLPVLARGASSSYFIKADGSLWGWGFNGGGQLAQGNYDNVYATPTPIGVGNSWQQITGGGAHTLALQADGSLWAWGYNFNGELGQGTTTLPAKLPLSVGTDKNWKAVAAGNAFGIGLKNNGSLWSWGNNAHGELGLGTDITPYKTPTQIGSDLNWKSISISPDGYHTLAIKNDGSLWAWGYNYHAELGLGHNNNQTSPMQIGSDHDWRTVAAGQSHSLALKSDGSLWGWGDNTYGQLGLGFRGQGDTPSGFIRPTHVGSGTDWKAISTSGMNSFALKNDGTLWSWGLNFHGELGLGDTDFSHFGPTQIGSSNNWNTVVSSSQHTMATKNDGSLWVWGENSYGRLGLGTFDGNYVTTPAQIDAAHHVSAVLSPAVRNFGTVLRGNTKTLAGTLTINTSSMNISNYVVLTGAVPYAIDQSSSGRCTTGIIAGTCSLNISTTPTSLPGSYAANLLVLTPDNFAGALVQPLKIQVTGAKLEVSAGNRDLGQVNPGQSARQIVSLHNAGNQDLHLGNLGFEGSAIGYHLSADSCSGTTLATTANCTITVRFSPVHGGRSIAKLVIASDEPVTPRVELNYSATGNAPWLQTKNRVDFGAITPGDQGDASLTISNGGTQALVISQASLEAGKRFQIVSENCSTAPIAAHANCSISLKFSPDAFGTFSDQLNISSNDLQYPLRSVAILGKGL